MLNSHVFILRDFNLHLDRPLSPTTRQFLNSVESFVDSSELKNYRPVSDLSYVSKVIEQLELAVFSRLKVHWKAKKF